MHWNRSMYAVHEWRKLTRTQVSVSARSEMFTTPTLSSVIGSQLRDLHHEECLFTQLCYPVDTGA